MRGADIPDEAKRNTIRYYDELHHKFDLFLNGEIESNLLIVARSGIGKSFYLKQNADRRITHLMEGNLRPLQTYIDLYQHRHKLVIIDDAETLWSNKSGRIILRELTETNSPKTISWSSTSSQLDRSGVPHKYETTSRVCIICNSFRFGDSDETAAIFDRCCCYNFDPINTEVAEYVAEWFWDQKVFDYAMSKINEIDKLTARQFLKASERRRKGDRTWKNEFPLIDGDRACVRDLVTNGNFQTVGEQVSEFQHLTNMSRATFMRYKKELKERCMLSADPHPKTIVKGELPKMPIGVDAILAEVEALHEEVEEEDCYGEIDGERSDQIPDEREYEIDESGDGEIISIRF